MDGMSVNRRTPESCFSTATSSRWFKDPPEARQAKASFSVKTFAPSMSCVTAVSPLSDIADTDLMEK